MGALYLMRLTCIVLCALLYLPRLFDDKWTYAGFVPPSARVVVDVSEYSSAFAAPKLIISPPHM